MDRKTGLAAVTIARKTIESLVKSRERYKPEDYPPEFNEKSGVFVTIYTWPEKELRGCIGYPEPVFPLVKALTEAAMAAAQDPRFDPLEQDELDKVVVEVSVLTKPELIKVSPKDYAKNVKVGRDGLIVRHGFRSGLLLPQVATEYKWGPEEFLSQTCVKAGLSPDTWLDRGTEVFRFQSLIFSEKSPGKV